MQPGSQPEDIQTIMSRFHTWAGKNPGNGNTGKLVPGSDAVREIPYEEAMRNFRQRRTTQTRRAATAPSIPWETTPANPEATLPIPAAIAAQPDAAIAASPVPMEAKPTALARRSPGVAAKAAPAPDSGEKKVARKKVATREKKACATPAALAVHPIQPKALRAQQKTPTSSKAEPRRAASSKQTVALTVRQRVATPKKPAFKKVLAKTVRNGSQSRQSTRRAAAAPDRNQRITTRFSAAEQRRLERAASQAGLTVSAWLRQCALHAEAGPARPIPQTSIGKTEKAASLASPAGSTLFSTPAPSGLGNWITLLRQRFLSSPARFSERA
jgi:hypothetical protein